MAIHVNLDEVLRRERMTLTELSVSEKMPLINPVYRLLIKVPAIANLSNLKTGKAKAMRFTTLDALCRALDCQPGDILAYSDED